MARRPSSSRRDVPFSESRKSNATTGWQDAQFSQNEASAPIARRAGGQPQMSTDGFSFSALLACAQVHELKAAALIGAIQSLYPKAKIAGWGGSGQVNFHLRQRRGYRDHSPAVSRTALGVRRRQSASHLLGERPERSRRPQVASVRDRGHIRRDLTQTSTRQRDDHGDGCDLHRYACHRGADGVVYNELMGQVVRGIRNAFTSRGRAGIRRGSSRPGKWMPSSREAQRKR